MNNERDLIAKRNVAEYTGQTVQRKSESKTESIPSDPILVEIDDDAKVATIQFVDGRSYKLQHPGNRKALRWRQESISLTDGLNQDKLLDKFFKFCVKPVSHSFEPTLDNIEPNHVEVWLRMANRFLKWELE
ncbi:hypothetical protein L9Z41_16865 [Leptospira noguchii]|uniref:LIC_12613 family protein n=1 Tax=Leptospira noguchii TaxID=28182 RepID=UPI001F060318|nr:hypothetical protein [Leptospira noguchii]MCH1910649.1 hypothetical protein [Leptospira noguchii]MCH1911757.1 hypothetical protein [Leptospira noguchii]MCH1913092.1 hypothetical protein [Leptospira noguchii]MCH1913761.1 hypothetical protein [Leptospira noguchii]MCH1915659.1 hypothetical protein [Leptospira noguchii]